MNHSLLRSESDRERERERERERGREVRWRIKAMKKER